MGLLQWAKKPEEKYCEDFVDKNWIKTVKRWRQVSQIMEKYQKMKRLKKFAKVSWVKSFEDSEQLQWENDKGMETDKSFSVSDNQYWALMIEFRAQIWKGHRFQKQKGDIFGFGKHDESSEISPANMDRQTETGESSCS